MTDVTNIPLSLIGHLRGTAHAFHITALAASMHQGKGQVYYDLRERIEKPALGSLVAEISSYRTHGSNNDNPDAVGYLLEMDGDTPEGRVKVRTLDGREVEWTNCHFVGVPDRLP